MGKWGNGKWGKIRPVTEWPPTHLTLTLTLHEENFLAYLHLHPAPGDGTKVDEGSGHYSNSLATRRQRRATNVPGG